MELTLVQMTRNARQICLITACTLLGALICPVAVASRDSGPAFTDNRHISTMPPAWGSKPVRYEEWAKGADIAVSLDQQIYPAFAQRLKDFAAKKGIRLAVTEGTCGVSAGMMSRKSIDVGAFCCPPGFTDRLPDMKFTTLGIAAISLITHTSNPVSNVSVDQARRIFKGKIYRWSELEGANGNHKPIQLVGRLHCKTRPGHWRLLLDNEDMFGANLQEVGAIPDMLSRVASVKRAIGFETMWMVRRYGYENKVRSLTIDGVGADNQEKILAGKYPMYRTYNIAAWSRKELANKYAPEVIAFLRRLVETEGDSYGIIPASRLKNAGWKFDGEELIGGI